MQLKVSLRSGETLTLQLPDDLETWKQREADADFQASITGLGLVREGQYHALPAPSAFRRVLYMVEARYNGSDTPTAYRAGYVADDVMASITIYSKGNPPMSRFDVRRTGKLRWRP